MNKQSADSLTLPPNFQCLCNEAPESAFSQAPQKIPRWAGGLLATLRNPALANSALSIQSSQGKTTDEFVTSTIPFREVAATPP